MMKITRVRALALAFALAALALAFHYTPSGSAQEPAGSIDGEQRVAGGLDAAAIDAFATRGGEIDVVVELNEEPTAVVYGRALARGRQEAGRQRGGDTAKAMPEVARQANAEARAQLDRINQSQRSVLARLRAPGVGGRIIFQTQRVFNGFGVKVNAASLAQIRALPEVKEIYELVPNVPGDTLTTKFIKSPEAWVSRPGGNAGEGVKIAIIDTGIDYLHTSMGGPGTGYAANNTNTIGDAPYPSAKVVGGWDFVGDAYNGSNTPIPDADPMDCNGHGSHVAGTAAGLGVNSNGTTFAGPYDGSVPFEGLRIGPGVAPKAELYALKVFGCSGSTGVTPQAIEWAVDPNKDGDFSDRLDVINMSLGSPFGTSFDASAVAADNAVLAGVIVVASAGNSGDTHYITGSPGSSGRTISVAASNGDGFNAVRINGPAAVAGLKPVGLGTRPALTDPGVTGNVVLALDAAEAVAGATTTDACSPLTNAAAVNGNIALLDRGVCSFDIKVKNAQNAGARGVIVADNAAGLPIGMTISDLTITIPSVRVTQADGNALKANLAGQNATIAATQFTSLPDAGDTLGSFSSRGVRRGDNMLKPDVTAPGVAITSTAAGALTGGNGTLGRDLQGTSMAAPHVAGAMALLRQMHPDWSVEELKALVMNTATHDLFASAGQTGNKFGVGRIGAGRVNMENASSNEVVAMNADGGGFVNLSFGAVEVLGTATREKTVRVVNKGTSAQTYTLSYVNITDVPGVGYSFPDGTTLVVGPGETKTFRVRLNANAALMKHTRDLTMATTQGNTGATNPRHWLSEAAGYVLLTPETGRAMRVSAHAFARPASGMTTAQQSLLLTSPTGTGALTLTGQDVNTGNTLPTDERSFVTAFELAATSPDEPNNLNLRNNADLKAVGVTSDARSRANFADTLISFGVATHGKWTTTFDVEFDVYIDTNLDGVDDYVLFNTATVTGTAPNTNRNDVPVVQLNKLNAPGAGAVAGSLRFVNGLSASTINTVPYNTNVMAMTVNAGHLGLTATNSRFRYRVLAFDRNTATAVDVISGLTYDAAKPGLSFTGTLNPTIMPSYFDLNGGAIPFNYNVADFKAANSQGVLLLHHHNTDGNREQVIPFAEPAATTTTVAPAAGQYSDQVTLTATVSPTTHFEHTATGNVTFSVNGTPVGSAPLGAGGVATLPYAIAQPAGVHNITAAFASTSPAFLASSSVANTLTVSKEDAVVTPAASNPVSVKVNTAGGTAGPITLAAQIVEAADGSLGDIANASPVTFTLTPVGPGSAIVQTATLAGSGAGPLMASVTLTNVPVNVYDVTISVGGNHYAGSGSTVLAVFDPSLGGITGGGTINRNGVIVNFGFNIKYLKNGNAQGQLLYIEHRAGGPVKLKSNAMGTASVAGDTGVILGKATLGEVGNHSFRATVVDKGEPGTADQFGMQVTSPAGTQTDIWFNPLTLSGGNVRVGK